MPINILMPALSPTMEKGNLAKWLKKEGDAVKTGDVIAEIETDKATMEYEAVEDGTLAKIVVPEGTSDVPVNQLIAVMAAGRRGCEGRGVGCGEGRSSRKAGGGAEAGRTCRKGPPRLQRRTASATPSRHRRPHRGRRARRRAANGHDANRVFSSPLARRLAKEAGIDVGRIEGSGPHGRVIARDVAAAK